jgi:hypothetical protein
MRTVSAKKFRDAVTVFTFSKRTHFAFGGEQTGKVKNTSGERLDLRHSHSDRHEGLSEICLGAQFPLKQGNHEPAEARNFAANCSRGGNDAAGISVRSTG